MAQRETSDDVGDGLSLAAVGLQELEPGGRGGEEVARLDPCAERLAAGLDRAFHAVLDDEPETHRRARGPGADFEPRNRGDRRQRLAAEAEGRDRGQVAVGNFRGRVPLDRQAQIRLLHAAPIVGNADQPAPARLDRDLDVARARVERVLHELLDRRGRPLDHFAGGDAVNQQWIETANRHGRGGPRPGLSHPRGREGSGATTLRLGREGWGEVKRRCILHPALPPQFAADHPVHLSSSRALRLFIYRAALSTRARTSSTICSPSPAVESEATIHAAPGTVISIYVYVGVGLTERPTASMRYAICYSSSRLCLVECAHL